MDKIYLYDFEKHENTTVTGVLDTLIDSNYGSRRTIHEDGSTQCASGCNRSIYDISKIIKTYYENKRFPDIYKEIIQYVLDFNLASYKKTTELYKKTGELGFVNLIYFYNCNDIDEVVLIRSKASVRKSFEYNKEDPQSPETHSLRLAFECIYSDEYTGINDEFYTNDGLTMDEILEELGIEPDQLIDLYNRDLSNETIHDLTDNIMDKLNLKKEEDAKA